MSDMSEFNISIVEKIIQIRLMTALETDTDNPIYEEHNSRTILNYIYGLSEVRKIKEREAR